MIVKRSIIKAIQFCLDKYPVIAITGPRQAGKTTFLQYEFPEYTYVNLEKPDAREFAESDPQAFLKQFNEHMILDEVQRVPSLFSYLQVLVDEKKTMGRFILSGSQNFLLMQSITQSLAGRVALFRLFPFDFSEMRSAGLLETDYAVVAQRGSYPALFDRAIPSKVFYSNYIQTYIERDLSALIRVRDLRQFRNFLGLCAGRAGQLLNLNAVANECGISQPTARSWMSVLENSYIVFILQPYFSNIGKRITKTPKLYFCDTGLLCHLLKIYTPENLKVSEHKGRIFENLVISEFIKNNHHMNLYRDHWFWRDKSGHEVDLLWQHDEGLNLVEIKATTTISQDLLKGLYYLENIMPGGVKSKTLVYSGIENQERTTAAIRSWLWPDLSATS